MYDYQEVFSRIGYMRANSTDIRFHEYLDKKLSDAELKSDSPENILKDIEFNYQRYLSLVQSASQTTPPPTPQAATPVQTAVPVTPSPQFAAEEKKISGWEYKIGAGVLSVVGSIFVILGLFFLGKYFLSDIFVGILIFVLGAVVTAVGEFVVWKRNDKLGAVISGIGYGTLYVACIVCNMAFSMYNIYVMLGIAVLISVAVYFSARFHKSIVPELILLVGMAFMMLPTKDSGYMDFYIVATVGMVLQFAILLASNAKETQFAKAAKLTVCFIVFAIFYGCFDAMTKNMGTTTEFMMVGMILAYIALFFVGILKNAKQRDLFIYSTVLAAIVAFFLCAVDNWDLPSYVAEAVFAVLCILFFFITRKENVRWVYYGFFALTFASLYTFCENEYVTLLVILGILILSKLALRFKETCIIDCVLSVAGMAVAVYYCENPISYAIIFVLLLGAFLAEQYKLFHEILVMAGTALFGLVLSVKVDQLWVSIVIMAIAFCSIGIGCVKNRFEIRMYGLILSLIVCFKVALYDYRDADELMKMIVFLVDGAIAIAISFVYIIIEKHEQNHQKEKQECAIEEPLKQEPLQ